MSSNVRVETKNMVNKSDIDPTRKMKNLPLDFYPDCWVKDEERMDVLFNPFRPKNVNPINYESKMKFWKQLIVKYCNEKGSASASESELKNAFIRNGRKPLCLSTVLEDMRNNHEIEYLHKFMVPAQHSWKDWAVDVMVKKPASWGWNLVKDRIFAKNSQTEEMSNFVVLESVKKHAEALQIHNIRNEVLVLDDVISKSHEIGLSAEGVEYTLHFLKRNQQVDTAVIDVNDEATTVVKFAKLDSKTSITDSDKAMFNLNRMEQILTKRTETLESQIQQMDEKIRMFVREKNREMAKSYLKRKKMVIIDLEKQLAQLQHISTLKSNIENAKYNAGVIETYKMGAKALKDVYEESGLNVDKVENVMNDVQDVIDDHDEIQNIVGAVNISNANEVDDLELEQELQDLMNDDRNDNDSGLVQPNRTNPDDSLERRLTNLKLPLFENLSLHENEQSHVPSRLVHN
ncbi:Charged multivesicular body protein 7 [Pseudolycoriella hygida]|uniref:Charged multivesicular body protein 7 n=1 Tax=Pseudolycoriella hygida TaxID=35572 RepID=A0A9Q0ND26_9DIPT|nr:Charged multivesicular body protein 7 [Pseudolycoriella hygida]